MALVHIQGMGVVGSFTAWALSRAGIAFTWHDIETPLNAWNACTGSVHPPVSDTDMAHYSRWREWHLVPMWAGYLPPITELGAFWYRPYKDKSRNHSDFTAEWGPAPLRLHAQPSVHINAQALVRFTREHFATCRTESAPANKLLIVAQGFDNPLRTRFVWGWSRHVALAIPDEMARQSKQRPAIYVGKGGLGPMQYVYAFPVPTSPFWYAGSSMHAQLNPHLMDTAPRLAIWRRVMREVSGGAIRIEQMTLGDYQGWRPIADRSNPPPLVQRVGQQVIVAPMGANGIHYAPLYTQAILEALL